MSLKSKLWSFTTRLVALPIQDALPPDPEVIGPRWRLRFKALDGDPTSSRLARSGAKEKTAAGPSVEGDG